MPIKTRRAAVLEPVDHPHTGIYRRRERRGEARTALDMFELLTELSRETSQTPNLAETLNVLRSTAHQYLMGYLRQGARRSVRRSAY